MIAPSRSLSLWDMLELTAERFSRALMDFTMMRRLLGRLSTTAGGPHEIDAASQRGIIDILDKMEAELAPIGADFTAMAIRDLRVMIKEGERESFILSPRAHDIERRLQDELKSITLFMVDKKDADLYENAAEFLDHKSQQAFPTVIFDCEEASKCLAFGRYTAAVFHVMHAAEAAVIELARALGATVNGSNGETLPWGMLARNIGAKITEMSPGPSRDRWHEAQMFLVSCNRAFRTKTAHPVQTYTKEQAEEALASTRSFIRSVASLV